MACHVNMHVSQAAMSGYHVNMHISQAAVSGLPCEHACKPGCYEWLTM